MRRFPRIAIGSLAVLSTLGILVGSAVPADAHPFLVRTDPPDGARLRVAPRTISLQFSEALGEGRPSVMLASRARGPAEPLPVTTAAGGRVLRGDVAIGAGLYTVSWRVVADDGHLSDGRFSFAVGPVTGPLPAADAKPAPANPLRSAAGWLFFMGLALSAGSLATASFVDRDPGARRRPLSAGLVVALAGALAAWAASIGGFAGPPGGSRQQILLATTAALFSLAVPLRRRPAAVGVAVTAATVAWAGRGQVAVSKGGLGLAVDATHLLAGAVWVGALILLAADLWRARHHPRDLAERARRYAALAGVPVVILASSGAVSALLMVRVSADLWRSGYGRLLGAKTLLLAGALALAWAGRRALRPGGAGPRPRLARVEAALLGAVLGVAAVLANTVPPGPRVAVASLLGPPPLQGPVVRDAGLAGILTVSVAAGDGRLQIEVVAPGGPARGTRVDVSIETGRAAGGNLALKACGEGCLSGPWMPPPGATTVRIRASAPSWRGGEYMARIDWPPSPEEPALLARVLGVMRAQPAVEMTERTSSGPDSVVNPAVIRGTGSSLVDEAPYASGAADDVRPLAGSNGFTLFLPGDRIWATLWLDAIGRLSRERIVSLGHLIEREYRYPDG